LFIVGYFPGLVYLVMDSWLSHHSTWKHAYRARASDIFQSTRGKQFEFLRTEVLLWRPIQNRVHDTSGLILVTHSLSRASYAHLPVKAASTQQQQ